MQGLVIADKRLSDQTLIIILFLDKVEQTEREGGGEEGMRRLDVIMQ